MKPVTLILNRFLAEKKQRNRSYSLRAFARDTGVNQGLLSQILNEKQALSLRQAIKIATSLELSPGETKELLQARAKSEAGAEELHPPTTTPQPYICLDLEQFRVISVWYHVAILDLATTDHFDSRPEVIADRLGISLEECIDGIDRLLKLGHLQRDQDGNLRKTHKWFHVPTKDSLQAIRTHHRQMIEKSLDELKKDDAKSFNSREISSITFAGSRSQIAELQRRIDEFKREVADIAQTSDDCDDVFQLNIQLFPLTSQRQ